MHAEKKDIAEVIASIHKDVGAMKDRWLDNFDWGHIPYCTGDIGQHVYDSFKRLLKEIDAARAATYKKYNESPAKVKARELREKADELLTQAKELEDEL